MSEGTAKLSISWWAFCCWMRPSERRRTNTCMPKRSNMTEAEKSAAAREAAAARQKPDPKKRAAAHAALKAANARMHQERDAQNEKARTELEAEEAAQSRLARIEENRKDAAAAEGRAMAVAKKGNDEKQACTDSKARAEARGSRRSSKRNDVPPVGREEAGQHLEEEPKGRWRHSRR